MKLRKVIFPTDFSPLSQQALHYATALARDTGATLLITHVEEDPLAYGAGEGFVAVPQWTTEAIKNRLESVVPPDPRVEHEHRLLMGDPASMIVQLAQEEKADLIVMGTHGRSGLSRLLMGSVAEQVVRQAPCPVLTIKQPQAVPAPQESGENRAQGSP